MRYLLRVEVSVVTAEWAVVWRPAGAPVEGLAWSAPGDPGEFAGHEVYVARARLERYTGSAGAPAGSWAHDALRVAARHPRLGFETDHRTIPHEVGWIGRAVHLEKGCYRGQETVARVQNLGKPPRRLVLLHLSGDTDELPPAGTPVELDGRAVGFLGTAVQHYELGPIALAVVKRSLPDDARLIVAGHPVAIDAE